MPTKMQIFIHTLLFLSCFTLITFLPILIVFPLPTSASSPFLAYSYSEFLGISPIPSLYLILLYYRFILSSLIVPFLPFLCLSWLVSAVNVFSARSLFHLNLYIFPLFPWILHFLLFTYLLPPLTVISLSPYSSISSFLLSLLSPLNIFSYYYLFLFYPSSYHFFLPPLFSFTFLLFFSPPSTFSSPIIAPCYVLAILPFSRFLLLFLVFILRFLLPHVILLPFSPITPPAFANSAGTHSQPFKRPLVSPPLRPLFLSSPKPPSLLGPRFGDLCWHTDPRPSPFSVPPS